MDTKKLRQKILDLAIRGKLVPQNPNDEPASVLLERIRAEKERLIKEGKIKKSKTSKTADTPHYENMPSGWCITNIGELLINRDGERKPVSSAIRSRQENRLYDYYGAAGVIDKVDDYLFDERLLLIGEDGANLLSRSKNNAFFAEGKYWVNNHAHVLDATDKSLLDYVAIVINAIKLDDYVTGSAQPKLSQDNLNKIPILLPPLKEQKRILVEINRWFALIDQIEQGKADLQATIKQTKSKILDLAIHGKLVPQNPNDEPASELLKRINPKAEITCDNGQYGKLPMGWVWTSVNDISKSILYGVSESAKSEGKYKLLRITDIQNNQVNWGTVPFTDFEDNKVSSYILYDGDIVFARTGATVGKSYLIKGLSQKAIYASYLIRVRMFDLILPEYVKHFFESDYYWEQIQLSSVGIGQPNVNGTILGKLNIPIPPLAEQQRIVAKIEELFSSLDRIQKALEV